MDKFQVELTDAILNFRRERNWEQFHTPKDMAMNLSIEANEALELFLWKSDSEVDKERLKEELGDVLYALLLLAQHFEIDLKTAFLEKMEKNAAKYPVTDFFNSNRKYNE